MKAIHELLANLTIASLTPISASPQGGCWFPYPVAGLVPNKTAPDCRKTATPDHPIRVDDRAF
jgi:hypothetical protein